MNDTDSSKNAAISRSDQANLAKAACELIGLAALDLIAKMQPPFEHVARARVALVLNIAENFQATNILVRAGLATHAAMHVRAMLESFVHMTMLGTDGSHLDQMTYDKIVGEIKTYEELLKAPYLSSESKSDLVDRLAKLRPQRQRLRDKGLKKKTVSGFIAQAKLPHLASAYTVMCSIAHWDLAVLSARHEKDGGGMKFLDETPDAVLIPVLSNAMLIMACAVYPLEQLAQFPEGFFASQFEKINKAWGLYLQSEGQNGWSRPAA